MFTVLLAALVDALSTSRDRALVRVGKAAADLHAGIDRRELVEARLREREAQLNTSALTDARTGRLGELLGTPCTVDDQLIAASVSVGLATPREGGSSAQLLERADSTMYVAKAVQRST